MRYPCTPFDNKFNTELITNVHNAEENNQIQKLDDLFKWLCTPPKISSYRVNTLTHTVDQIYNLFKTKFPEFSDKITKHPILSDVILIHNLDVQHLDLTVKEHEVIVDADCGAAVLRGADIFAPGVIGMQTGLQIGEKVSIYVDTAKCKRGFSKVYDSENKVFVGNGIVKMTRRELFGNNLCFRGVAINVYSSISGCPNIQMEYLPKNSCTLQNLPSIICSYVLNPKPGDTILDMCASPGNKTTHIASLMLNNGKLIAIDKTPTKLKQLKETCVKFSAIVDCYQADSTKIFDEHLEISTLNEPPYAKESFDKILLDAPCSALGKRPQICNKINEKILRSYVPLQRKLFKNAVNLLKENGRLVYSTCTITVAENEGIVAWALKTFNCLKLIKAEPYLGSHGWKGSNLKNEELCCLQRFDHKGQIDSVGFFIACFIKKKN